MHNVSVRNARDLDRAARTIVERLLGRRLNEEEQVTVMAFPIHSAPTGGQRETAARRLAESLDAMAAQARTVPQQELDDLIDEAVEHVRGHQP